jgi:phage-related protein
VASLGDLVARLLLDATGFSVGMKQAKQDAEAGAGAMEAALGGVSAGLGAMATALGGIEFSEKMMAFAESAMHASMEFGKFRAAVVNMRGDGEDVVAFLEHVREIADKSPFAFPEVSATAQRMVQLGGSLEDVTKTLQSVVDFGTALKLSSEQVQSIAKGLGNLQAGMDPIRVMNKLVRDGVPVWAMLSEQTGKSIGEVKAAVKDGAISNKEILDALTENMSGYHEAAEKWASGFKGSMKGLHDAVEYSMKGIGDSIFQALNTVAAPVIKMVTKLVTEAGEIWGKLSTPVQTAVLAFGAIVAAVAPLVALWPVIEGGLALITGALAGPLIPIAALVAALVGLGLWISEHWEGISHILITAWDSLQQIWGAVWADVLTTLTAAWNLIKTEAVSIWTGLVSFFTTAFDIVTGIWKAIWNGISTILTTVWGSIFTGAKSIFSPLIEFLVGLFQPVIDAWNKVVSTLAPFMAKLGATGAVVSKAFADLTEEMGKSVPVAEKVTKTGKGVTDGMDDTSKSAKEQKDAYKGLSGGAQELWAIYNQLTSAHKKLADDIAKHTLANEKLAASGKTVYDVLDAIPEPTMHVSKAVEQLNQDIAKTIALMTDAKGSVERAEAALKAMGITSTRMAENALELAKSQLETVKSAGDMVTAYDRLSAQANVLKAQIELLSRESGDHRDELEKLRAQLRATEDAIKGMSTTTADAYHSMGMKSKEELRGMADDALVAFNRIAEDAGDKSGAAKKAWLDYLEIVRQEHEDFGTEWSAEDEKQYRKMKADLDGHHKDQEGEWEKFFKDVGKAATQFKNDVLDLIVFGKGGSAEHNKELDQQAADLQTSLNDRTAEWTAYQADVAKQQSDATADYKHALDDNAQALADSLASAASDYEEYAKGVEENIADIVAKHQAATEEQVQNAEDALQKQRDSYAEFASDTAEKISDIHAKYADSLADEERDLADSLKHRAQSYADFVDDATDKLARIGQDTATNIQDETDDTKRNIADRTKDYNRYAEDTAKKIAAVREKNKGVYSSEEADLETSLRRKQEDLAQYTAEQNDKLERYIRDQQTRLQREEEDNKESLDRRARDEDEWLADTKTKYEEKVSDLKASEDKEVTAANEALDKRTAALATFTEDTKAKIEDIRTTQAKAQDDEVAKQEAALAQKESDYNASVEKIKAKSEEQKTKINGDYEAATAKQSEELAKQSADYEKFKNDIIGPGGKLDQLKEQHRTVWQDIGGMAVSALEGIGQQFLHLASDQVIGVLLGKLGGMKGILGDLGSALDSVFQKSSSITTPGAGASPGGGAGGAASAVSGGLTGWISAISGAVTAISSVIGNFQMAKMETSLNGIEHNTRYSMMFLGERADGGILGVLFKIDEEIAWGTNTKATEKLRDLFLDWSGPTLAATMDLLTLAQTSSTALETIRDYASSIAGTLGDMLGLTYSVADSVGKVAESMRDGGARSITVNVTAAGLTTSEAARALGNQIAQNLSMQMVAVR